MIHSIESPVEGLLSSGTHSYFVGLAQKFGSPNVAILASFVLSRQKQETKTIEHEGRLYTQMSQRDIYENTGLSPEMAETAKRILKEAGVLFETSKGMPAKRYTHVCQKAIAALINKDFSKSDKRRKGQRPQQPLFTVAGESEQNNTITLQPLFTVPCNRKLRFLATAFYGCSKNTQKQYNYAATVNYGSLQPLFTVAAKQGQKTGENRKFLNAHLNYNKLYNSYLFFLLHTRDESKIPFSKNLLNSLSKIRTQNSTPNVEDKKNSSPASVDFFHLRAENPIPPSPAAPPFPLPPSEHVPTHRDAQPIAPFKPQEPTTVTDALNDLNSAVKQSMDFLRANPDQLTQWISLSRWVGQRSDIEGTLTAFFGYYQGKQSKEGDAYRNPLVFLTRNFFAWLKNDKPKPKPGQPQYQSQYNQPQPQPANPYKNVRVFGA